MLKEAALLIVLLLAAIAVYSLVPRPGQQGYDDNSVKQFVLEDAQNDYPGASLQVLSFEPMAGKWAIDVKIAVAAHSKCPKLYRRYYSFPPIYFREETISDNCTSGGKIIYPEEAIIASSASATVKALPDSATADARAYPVDEITALQNCTECSPLETFAKSLPSQKLWIVQWTSGASTKFVAVDDYGKIIAQG